MHPTLFDLITPDGRITSIRQEAGRLMASVVIEPISPDFLGYQIDHTRLCFNLKSVLAQLGVEAKPHQIALAPGKAKLEIELIAIGDLAYQMLALLQPGAAIGKLFACDDRRIVRDPFYLERMFDRTDSKGRPLLQFGSGKTIRMEKMGGRTIAYVPLLPGCVTYEPSRESMQGLLPTIAKALCHESLSMRGLLTLHQHLDKSLEHRAKPGEIFLVKTEPLHIRTLFAKVASDLLPKGLTHTRADLLDPTTQASGDIYEFHGEGEIEAIPLEFYTLKPSQEWVSFSDRDQLKNYLNDSKVLFDAFTKGPSGEDKTAVFVCKSNELVDLKKENWTTRSGKKISFPGFMRSEEQIRLIEQYIESEPSYPWLQAIERGEITSEGVLFCRYLPSPLIKRMLLSSRVYRCIKRIYFERPSKDQNDFFTHEDRAMLLDLAKFGIPVYWVDRTSGHLLRYVPRMQSESGMFVPVEKVETFLKATLFGVYGSNLIEGDFEKELRELLSGVLALQKTSLHPLLKEPIALVTGGGPGAMAVGNRIAKDLGILSCANIVDFGAKGPVNEQKQNPHIEAKMTYSLDHLVERQAEFNLDFPLFLPGGIGTDFEYALEEVRRKVGSHSCSPVLLFGGRTYWESKITPRFQTNLRSGTIKGSEWVSNCFYAIESAGEGLEILRRYFDGTLPIGPNGPISELGFSVVS